MHVLETDSSHSWGLNIWDDLSLLGKNSLAGNTGRWLYPAVQSREPGWSS